MYILYLTVPNRCEPPPCENGGLCVDRGYDAICTCPSDFMGEFCNEPGKPKTIILRLSKTETIFRFLYM